MDSGYTVGCLTIVWLPVAVALLVKTGYCNKTMPPYRYPITLKISYKLMASISWTGSLNALILTIIENVWGDVGKVGVHLRT